MEVETTFPMLIECQAKDLGNTGKITLSQFREALIAVHWQLSNSEIQHIIREIEAVEGKVAYEAVINQYEL